MRVSAFVVLLTVCSLSAAQGAPLSYTGGNYTQDFDGLPQSGNVSLTGRGPHELQGVLSSIGVEGWQIANPDGSSATTEFRAQNGSQSGSAGRGVVSFGTTGSSDRALGALATSNQISTFGLVLVNNTDAVLDSFTLEYTGEQWRRGNVASPGNSLSFAYAVGPAVTIGSGTFVDVAELSFNSPNNQVAPTEVALDGNLAANQVAILGTVSGLNWLPGERLVLRWAAEDIGGQDDGLAIDNLTFSAKPVPEPASACMAAVGAVALAVVARRVRRATR